MRRFLSFLVAASLLGFTACSNEPDVDPDPEFESEFPSEGFVSSPNQAQAFEMEEDGVYEFSFIPAEAWSLNVSEESGPIAAALAKTRADNEPAFLLKNVATGVTGTAFEGVASPNSVTFALIVNAYPEAGAGVTALVDLTIGNTTQYFKAYVGNEDDAPGVEAIFNIYAGIPVESVGDDGYLFKRNEADDGWVYSEEPTTAVSLITADEYGDKGYMMIFKVVSSNDWIFTKKPVWLTINGKSDEGGAAGESEWTIGVEDSLHPIAKTTEAIEFINADESSSELLGSLDVTVPGCGDVISLYGLSFPSEAMFSADGRIYNENAGWMDKVYCQIYAAYGSKVFFVSEDNWINFAEEIEFATTDDDNNDLTKYGLQRVGGDVNVEPNGDEQRKAYLIAVPANDVTADITPEKVFVDGKVAADYEKYILATATQMPNISESAHLIGWAWSDDELGGFKRDEFAELSPIRPTSEVFGVEYFAKEWALVPIAYHLHYNNLEGSTVAGLTIPEETATIEFYDEQGPWTESAESTLKWADYTVEEGNLIINPAYDFEKDQWKVNIPDGVNWAEFPGFFVLRDKDGNIITWIMFTLNPEHYTPGSGSGNLISGAWAIAGDNKKMLGLIPMTEYNSKGYDPDFLGEQYELTVPEGFYQVSFEKIPAGSYKVYSPFDAEETNNDLFQKVEGGGNYFNIAPEGPDSGEFWVYFEGCLLYVTYGATSEPEPEASKILDAHGFRADGTSTSLGVPPTNEDSKGYDPDFEGEQYTLKLEEEFAKLGFGAIPADVTWVCTLNDPDTNLSNVFVPAGNDESYTYYTFNAPEGTTSGGVWVSFGQEGCLLYIEYNYDSTYEPATPKIMDARGIRADGSYTSLGVPPTNEGTKGYDPDFTGDQYTLKLEEDFSMLGFGTIPTDVTWVCTLDDPDTNLSNVFVSAGKDDSYTFYTFNAPEGTTSGGVWVSFGQEGCLLYIEYNYGGSGNTDPSGPMIAGAFNPVGNGGTISEIKELKSGDEGYEDFGPNAYPQYGITIRGMGAVAFDTLPDYESIEVWDANDQHNDWFAPQGPNTFTLYDGDDNVKFWVYFKKGEGNVCSLYVDYQW